MLTGPRGNNKIEIAKYAAKYCQERNNFSDGICEIQLGNKKDKEGLINAINETLKFSDNAND